MNNNKRKIMIIDDEEDLCEMMALRLTCLGFDVEKAHNGIEGLKKIKGFSPDIIILDVVMPIMDGWEVCQKIKSNPETRSIKVVVLTATQSDGNYVDKAKSFGADAALLKPCSEEDLLLEIQKN